MNGVMTALLYGGLVSYAGLVLINLNRREEIKNLRKKLKGSEKDILFHKKRCNDLIDLKDGVEKKLSLKENELKIANDKYAFTRVKIKDLKEEIKDEKSFSTTLYEERNSRQEIIDFDNDLLTEKTKIIERLTHSVEYHKKNSSFLRWSNKNIRTKFGKVRFIQLDKACKL